MKMRIGFRAWMLVAAAVAAGMLVARVSSTAQAAAGAQAPTAQAQTYRAPRTADGRPNLNGIWQALNEANWDLEPHAAAQGSVFALGAQFSIAPGIGVVDGGTIPYKPEALAKKKENFANRLKLDPEIKCYMGGVPRSTYMPYPFQIIQGKDTIMIAYEFAGAVRVVNMGKPTEAPTDSWMGWSNGRWEGETLVIDVTGLNDQTWFDRAGNYHSDALRVVERFTPRRHADVRGHDRRSKRLHASVEDQHAALSPS